MPTIDQPFEAELSLPGSKSIALRQLAMAALAEGTSRITGIPPCDDTEAMLDCLQQLGAQVTQLGADSAEVTGPIDTSKRTVELNARMSGASTRLLIGLAALREGATHIDGHASLRARTNQPLYDVLSKFGCQITSSSGGLPVRIEGPFRPPSTFEIDGSLSSQYISALLLAAPYYTEGSEQTIQIVGSLVSKPYIGITVNEMRKRGVAAEWVDEDRLSVSCREYNPGTIDVEGDATAATYFTSLATLHNSSITLTNLGQQTAQGDYQFNEVLMRLGAVIQADESTTKVTGSSGLQALAEIDLTSMPDAALTLITLAPWLPEPTHITGLSSLHHKECDRLLCPAQEFRSMGIHCETTHDSIVIQPAIPSDIQPHILNTYHDHRMAMAFSIIASRCGNLHIDDPKVVDKTYPNYWRDYLGLCGDSG